MKNPIPYVFFIGFIVMSSVTAMIFSNIVNSKTDIPYSIEADYFDIYQFNPVKDAPSRIIDQPNTYAFPQSRYDHNYISFNITQGSPSLDGKTVTSPDEFMTKTISSDDKYGSIIPSYATSSSSILKNYYVFTDKNGNHFLLPLSPDIDHYLAFDRIDNTSGTITHNESLKELSSRINIGNNPYLLPDNETYIQVESDYTAKSVSIDISTGGITVYNRSLYELYTVLDNHRKELIEGKFNPETFLNYFFSSDQRQYYEFAILNSIIQSRNRNFFIWFAEKCFSYESFLEGMGIELEKGYKIFANFNPYSVTKINGKIAIYFESPSWESSYPEFENYSVQCYNYVSDTWDTIMTRYNLPTLSMENTWLYDTFVINNNPWQYIYNFQGDSDTASEFIKYRIVAYVSRDPDDTMPIIMKIGGIWTALDQEFTEFNAEFTFKVSEPYITKKDLQSCKLIVEYHTEQWDSLYDGIYITQSIGCHEYSETYYNEETGSWETANHIIQYEIILDNGQLYSHPLSDTQVAISIPDTMIEDDTTVHVILHGKFSKYDRKGEINNPKIFFDKISMQYEYKKPIVIKRKTWINYNALDIFYWSYDINITSNIVYLEFSYPHDWIFIDRYFALIEKLDTGKNVSEMWIQSKNDETIDDLYDDDHVKIDSRVIFFLGSGTYRFWFRSFNYITDIEAYNQEGDPYNLGDQIEIDNRIFYNITITDTWNNPLNKYEYEGDMEITFTGYSRDGKSQKTIGPFKCQQYNYTINDYVYWNKYYLNYTHTYDDEIFGNIRIEVYWHNKDYSQIGYKIFWLYIAYISDEKPIISLITPTQGSRWGTNISNYVVLASWHINTISAFAEIEGKTIQLKRLSEIDENTILPESLLSVPSYLRPFYWFAPINVSYIYSEKPSIDIDVTVWSIAQYGSTIIYSDNITVSVTIVFQPQFVLDPVTNVPIGNKPRITYYCPDGIVKMDIYIKGSQTSMKILEIEGRKTTTSSYLYKGYHTLLLPYRFTSVGLFHIKLIVWDDVGNVIEIISNEFSVYDDDNRSWIMKILDDLVEIAILWFSYMSLGMIYLKKRKKGVL